MELQNLDEESSMAVTMTNILPHDLVVNILSRLPVKSLLRFRCVCKPWYSFFNNPNFIKMHLNHSINNYEYIMLATSCFYSLETENNCNESPLVNEVVEIDYPFKTSTPCTVSILGSCNGLLLITPYEDIYCIWNPSTKEFMKLPDTPIEFPKKVFLTSASIEYGFGYDKITEKYKVVRIVTFDDYSTEVKVYTLGTGSWRRIQDLPDNLALTYKRAAGKLVNGALHWVTSGLITRYGVYDEESDDEDEEFSYTVLSLGIEDEKYKEIQQPNFIDTKFHMNVEVFGGCLCIMCNFCDIRSEIWVMKEYGVKESWTKIFTIAQPSVIQQFEFVRPIKFTSNGEVVLVKDNTSIVIYDPKNGACRTLQIRGLPDWFETDTYVESLVSMNSGTFVGQEKAAWKKTLKNRKKKEKRISKSRDINMAF